jgi:hypothetical protein
MVSKPSLEATLTGPLAGTHPNSGSPEFGILDLPKSDTSDFGSVGNRQPVDANMGCAG